MNNLTLLIITMIILGTIGSTVGTCSTPACQTISGLSSSVSPACAGDLQQVLHAIQNASADFKNKQYGAGVQSFALGIHDLASSMTDCNVPALASKLQQLANSLFHGNVTWIDSEVKVLMQSADVYNDIYAILQDFENKNFQQMGQDIQALTTKVMAISGCTSDACKVASGLLDAVALVIEDIKPCETELETTFASLKTALSDWESQKYVQATHELSQALLNFQSSLQSCGLNDFAKLIDSEARALNHSNINVEGAVSVLVNDVEFASDIAKLASDAASESWPQVGQDLGALILDLQRSSCQSDACSIVISLASELQIVIQDLGQCKDDLDTSFSDFKGAVSDFQSKNYISAVKGLATGLDSIAESVKDCQLEKMAQILVTESAKLKLGNISEVNNIVSILVKDADVYDAIFGAVSDASQSNWAGFGGKIGNLVNDLQLTEHCSSPMCQIIEALLESMEVVGADLSGQCATDLENSWSDLQSALSDFESKNWESGLSKAASTLHDIGSALNDCNLSQLALIVQKAATQLGASNVTWISGDIKILISGGDIVNDLIDIGRDFGSKDYSAVGQSLGDLITRIGTFKCSTPVCVILNGILEELQIVVTNLKACESDIGAAYTDFENMVTKFQARSYVDGLKDLATGLYKVADGVKTCQLPELADKLNQQAQQLGITQVKEVDNVVHIIAGGAAIYDELFAAVSAFESHNFKSFGNNLGQAFLKLMTMSDKFGCAIDQDICTVTEGILQGLNLIQDLKVCKADLESAKQQFVQAFEFFKQDHALVSGASESSELSSDHDAIKQGLKEFAAALNSLAHAVDDCDVEQFAELIGKLAIKLGGPDFYEHVYITFPPPTNSTIVEHQR